MSHVALKAAAAGLFMTIAAGASAADLNRPYNPPAAAPQNIVAYAFNWTGAYAGGNLGVNFTSFSEPNYVGSSANSTALTGGLQAGYLWQIGQFVYGLEADVGLNGNRKTNNYVNGDAFSQRETVDWNFSFRGRLGYAFDRFLAYGTGGIGFANIKSRLNDTTTGVISSNERVRAGWALGAGLEYAVTDHVTVRGEYIHTDFGRFTSGYAAGISQRHSVSDDTLRMAVNYKF